MTIIEAIKSDKPFRRSTKAVAYNKNNPSGRTIPAWRWICVIEHPLGKQFKNFIDEGCMRIDFESNVGLNANDILADDWEVKND